MPPDMDLPRFFVPCQAPVTTGQSPPPPFSVGQEIMLPPGEAHHAAHVLRLKTGAAMELFDGCGGTAVARIVQVRKGGVTATVLTVRASAPRLAPLIHLAFAVPKGGRLDWLLEKATELGVAALAPVRFERSVAGGEDLSPAKRERWLGHCIAAAKQAGLCWLPAIENPQPLETFLASVPDGAGLFGDVGADAVPITQALCRLGHTSTVCIVIGPEGGLTPTEGIALRRKGLVPVRLGHTTLRVETAAVALVAAVLAVLET